VTVSAAKARTNDVPPLGTKSRAVIEARDLLQVYGFNGFSFQHVADRLGIKKPSLYEHFESKEELGFALIEDFRQEFIRWAKTISIFDPAAKIGALFELYLGFSTNGRKLCPVLALNADFNSLPKKMQNRVSEMMGEQQAWIAGIIADGQKQKVFRKDLSAHALGQTICALAYGAQQLGRTQEDAKDLRLIKRTALDLLAT
jgi:TetR/AcrR family transcriptional regulator, transcriptional repressor for nem operon